jgi:hypothetical protein
LKACVWYIKVLQIVFGRTFLCPHLVSNVAMPPTQFRDMHWRDWVFILFYFIYCADDGSVRLLRSMREMDVASNLSVLTLTLYPTFAHLSLPPSVLFPPIQLSIPGAELTEPEKAFLVSSLKAMNCLPVFLQADITRAAYHGYCKQVLLPIALFVIALLLLLLLLFFISP